MPRIFEETIHVLVYSKIEKNEKKLQAVYTDAGWRVMEELEKFSRTLPCTKNRSSSLQNLNPTLETLH